MGSFAFHEADVGQYFYMPHRRNWGVWLKTETGTPHVADFNTWEEARDFVYEKNGWKKVTNK